MSDASIFSARGIALGYGRHVLYRDVSLDIRQGAIVGIVGPNGSGKTTLLRTLLGLLPPLVGQVQRSRRVRVSYAPQRERLDPVVPVTSLDVVLMERTARARPLARITPADREAALATMAMLGVRPLAHRLFRSLSGGEQQRVRLARALAADPDVLVLDEPTAGMDVAGEVATIDFLRDLNRSRGVTVVIVTHALSIVLNVAASIVLIGARTIVQGPVDDVLRDDRLTALYGVPVHVGHVGGQRTVVAGRGSGADV